MSDIFPIQTLLFKFCSAVQDKRKQCPLNSINQTPEYVNDVNL